ncbi:MAG TPA: ATP-binding cassette domain-containing protein, partial [Pyrinomonadaceae bacterium]|nr:ATP-binding cassette domain-containing protein [Pyrinomonadaceae bacterium]
MNDDSDLIIKFEDVTKSYRDHGSVLALSSINISINRGERVAVMGPSGSGKSTLLNLMCGLDRPTLGSIFFEGRDLAKLSDDDRTRLRRERVGMIFQTFNLMPTLNAVENVALPLRLAGVAGGTAAEKARAMLG